MKGRADESGYSLIEVFIAIVFIGISIAALFIAITQGVYMQKVAEMDAIALDLANAAVDRHRSHFNAGHYELLLSRAAQEEQADLDASGRPEFNRTIAVNLQGEAPNRTWAIESSVTYYLKGKSRNVVCRTLFAE